MIFADAALAKRLEATEAFACAQFAEARKRLFPESTSMWMKCAGTTVVFDGVDAPTTQTFGLGSSRSWGRLRSRRSNGCSASATPQ